MYNWLRQHEPQVFLQDGEDSSTLAAAASKPGALRGAGKRASIVAQAKIEVLDGADDADSILLETPIQKQSKRKRMSEDDTGYRPKGGSSRPYKKKKKEDSLLPKKPVRKSKSERMVDLSASDPVKMEEDAPEE